MTGSRTCRRASGTRRARRRRRSAASPRTPRPPRPCTRTGAPRRPDRGAVGLADDADVERRRRADRLAADVAAVVEPVTDVGQADRIHVEHRVASGVVAPLARIAGDSSRRCGCPSRGRRADPTASRAGNGRGRQYCSTGSTPACCCTSTASDSALMRAPPRSPSLTDHHVDAARRQRAARTASASAASCPRGGSSSTAMTAGPRPARVPARDFSARGTGGLDRRRRARSATPTGRTARRPWRQTSHDVPDLPDVLGRRPAAAADETHAVLDEAPRVRRHVFRRAQVDVAALDVARLPALGCAESGSRDDAADALDRLEHRRGPDAAVDADDGRRRARSSAGHELLGRRAVEAVAVLLGRHLRDDRQVARLRTAAIAAPISFTSRNVSRMNRSTPPSSERRGLLAEAGLRLVDAGRPHGSMRTPSGPIAPATYAAVTRAPAARSRAPARLISCSLSARPNDAELDAVGAERVRLDDVGARAQVVPVHLGRPGPAR